MHVPEADVAVGIPLILLPIAFNVPFVDLAWTFDYPDILRHEPGQILARFHDGGTALLLRWWAFALVALAFVPIGAVVPEVLSRHPCHDDRRRRVRHRRRSGPGHRAHPLAVPRA